MSSIFWITTVWVISEIYINNQTKTKRQRKIINKNKNNSGWFGNKCLINFLQKTCILLANVRRCKDLEATSNCLLFYRWQFVFDGVRILHLSFLPEFWFWMSALYFSFPTEISWLRTSKEYKRRIYFSNIWCFWFW